VFGLFLGVEVVEVAVELVEAVDRREELIAVAQVVLADLCGGVAERLEQVGDRRIFLLQAQRGGWKADLGQPGAQAGLTGEERCPTGGAALLGVAVGEDHASPGDPVDIGRAIPHESHRVGADIRLSDVIAPDDHDVGLLAVAGGLAGQ
jgi:hypothetical protein